MTNPALQLVLRGDGVETRRVSLSRRCRIGRLSSVELPVPDPTVSKVHAVVDTRDGLWFIEDAGSRNGTRVNGVELRGRHVLSVGDSIGVGGTVLRVEAEPPPRRTGSFRVVDDQTSGGEVRARATLMGVVPEERFPSEAGTRDELQLRRDYEKLRIAYELTRAVLGEPDVDRLLERVLEAAVDLFSAERGLILLADPSGALSPVATRIRGEGEGDHFAVPGSILREVVEERQAVLSNDARTDARFKEAESVILHSIRATMSVPLLYGDRLYGVIHLDCQLSTDVFTERDLHLLTGFAQQAAHLLEHAQLLEARQQQRLTRERLARLLPPDVVNQVVDGRIRLERGGQDREATVLFVDIRGFTSWSERRPAEEIVSGLNAYFDLMTEVIFRWNGTLDKFIGDEIMAVWGAPLHSATHCEDAVRAALEMRDALVSLNEERARSGLEPMRIGIGINTGTLVAGYMGSQRAMSWTVIGDVVNVAARLCSSAAPGEVLISDSVVQRLEAHLSLGERTERRFKGKQEPLSVWPIHAWIGGEPQNG